MQCGVQRRTVFLAPPAGLDRIYIQGQFLRPEIYENFGFDAPAAAIIAHRMHEDLVVGAIRLSRGGVRIGFALMFPPTDLVDFWEFGYAITEVRHRNAFNAMNAMDAMALYMLELVQVPVVGGRTVEGNRAAAAIALRCGYRPHESRVYGGKTYAFYTLDQAGWVARKARLERGEAEHPYGTGAAFHVLAGPPYVPVPPPLAPPDGNP